MYLGKKQTKRNDVQLKDHQPIRRLLSHSIGSQYNEKKEKKKTAERLETKKPIPNRSPQAPKAKRQKKIHVLNTRNCPQQQVKPKKEKRKKKKPLEQRELTRNNCSYKGYQNPSRTPNA